LRKTSSQLKPATKAGASRGQQRKRLLAPAPEAAAVRKPRVMWSVRLGAASIVGLGLVFALMLGWALLMTGLLFSGNRLAGQAVARTAELQDSYELRILEYEQRLEAFRAEIARMVSEAEMARLDKGGVEGKLIELAQRQGRMETRHLAISRAVEHLGGLPIGQLPAAGAPAGEAPLPPRRPGQRPPPPANSEPPRRERQGALAPPRDGAVPPMPAVLRPADAVPVVLLAQAPAAPFTPAPSIQAVPGPQGDDIFEDLARRLEGRVARLERGQLAVVEQLARRSARQADLLQQALDLAGRALDRLPPPPRSKAVAPLVIVLSPQDQAGPFGRAVDEVRRSAAVVQRVRPTIEALPLARPVTPDMRVTSRFGTRSDPFLGTSRFHAGQDFATPTGTPVFATGAGVVLSAGDGGGYGNLVQIDHGNGVVTRYAHLSEMEVVPGQPVSVGTMVGRAGSTGRSTGPHLHYETRVEGEPEDPVRFMTVGEQLGLPPPRLARAP
jgi:murein DD-endopeptidase MepM/ murein hydrolase activator NlpD